MGSSGVGLSLQHSGTQPDKGVGVPGSAEFAGQGGRIPRVTGRGRLQWVGPRRLCHPGAPGISSNPPEIALLWASQLGLCPWGDRRHPLLPPHTPPPGCLCYRCCYYRVREDQSP